MEVILGITLYYHPIGGVHVSTTVQDSLQSGLLFGRRQPCVITWRKELNLHVTC